MERIWRQFLFLMSILLIHHPGGVISDICTSDICEYNFVLTQGRTMSYYPPGQHPALSQAFSVKWDGAKLVALGNSVTGAAGPLDIPSGLVGSEVNISDAITGNGFVRNILLVNGQYPGPPIEVMHGAQVVIHVTNKMPLQSTSIHWHGIYQQGTPWMDGAAFISQCPIPPSEKFTYRFTAHPIGTHWYHPHLITQRRDGGFGAFIVHKAKPTIPNLNMILNDIMEQDADTISALNIFIHRDFSPANAQINDLLTAYHPDNTLMASTPYQSGLINGRGRWRDNTLPLATFTVQDGVRYRFRVINAGSDFNTRVSVDEHILTVVAIDGFEMKPIETEFVLLLPAETLDFEITVNATRDRFWIRTVPTYVEEKLVPGGYMNETRAILLVQGADPLTDPTTDTHPCTEEIPCRYFPCPYNQVAFASGKKCLLLSDAESTGYDLSEYGISDDDDEDVTEIIMNVGFINVASINGRRFVNPRTHFYQSGASRDDITECDDAVCDEKGCICTNVVTLPYGKNIQLVLTNINPNLYEHGEIPFLIHHPMHLHGHGFAVVKQGFSKIDNATGFAGAVSDEIECKWPCPDTHWKQGFKPDLNLKTPVLKNVVVPPAGGYAVVRFKTNNPGYWLLHCHMNVHMATGLQVVFNVSDGKKHPPPKGFPTCGTFTWSAKEFADLSKREGTETTKKDSNSDITLSQGGFIAVVVCSVVGGGLIVLTVELLVLHCCKRSKATVNDG